MKTLALLFIVIYTQSAFAAAEPLDIVKAALKEFQEAPAVKAKVKKTAVYSLLDETKKSEGEIVFSKGLLRLDLSKSEDPSLIVMNDKVIWVETPNAWGDGKNVMKIVSEELKSRSRAPIAMLLKQKDILSLFNLTETKKEKAYTDYVFRPKDKVNFSDLSELVLRIGKDAHLESLSYKDDIDNKVTYEFIKPNFKFKATKKAFEYEPPKGAEVVVY